MAETALLMVESSPAFEGAKCRTMFIAYTFVLHAFRPMHVVMKKLFEAYEVGLSTGDVENAAQSVRSLFLDSIEFVEFKQRLSLSFLLLFRLSCTWIIAFSWASDWRRLMKIGASTTNN